MKSIDRHSTSQLFPAATLVTAFIATFATPLVTARRLAIALGLVMFSPTAAVFAAESDFSQPIDVSADRSEYNQKTGKQVLSGNVEIRQGSMLIRADTINVILKDNKLSIIEGQGSPIAFQQENELGELITGSCDAINYDAVNGILTMSGNAELKKPKQQLTSDSIVFNSINQSVVAQGGESGRVSITIQPPDRN